jgi:hypothetical protein
MVELKIEYGDNEVSLWGRMRLTKELTRDSGILGEFKRLMFLSRALTQAINL